jgi:DNA-binding transcriptional ArsR family regulator
MRPLAHPDREQLTLTAVLYALGDPVRLEIVRALADRGDLCCNAFDPSVAKSTMSHHFRILREAGLIYSRKDGTQHVNRLRREDLDLMFPGLLGVVLKNVTNGEINRERL